VERSIQFDNDQKYILFVNDTIDNANIVSRQIDQNQNPPRGDFSIRIANLASSVRSVDVYVVRENETITNDLPIEDGVSFRTFSRYYDIDEGRYRVVVTSRDSKQVLFDSGPRSFFDGDVFTFVITSVGSGPLQADFIEDLN